MTNDLISAEVQSQQVLALTRSPLSAFGLSIFIFFLLSFSFASAAELKRPPNNLGLVDYFPMDEGAGATTSNKSRVGTSGTITGATWVAGKKERALDFNNNGSYMTYSCGTNCVNYPYTVSLWFNADTLNGLLFGVNNGFNNSIAFTGGTYLHMSGNSNYMRGALASNFQTGRWYNMTAVYTSSTDMKMYINGVEQTVATDDWWTLQCANIYSIGSRNGGACASSLSFDGRIDDVRIYNRALPAADIANLYQLSFTKFNSSQNNKVTNGLVGLWSFDGADMSGVTAYDRSGQGNDGTLTNGPTRTIGKVGQGLNFDGVNDYVDAGSGGTLSFTGDITLSVWMKPDFLSDYRFYLSKYSFLDLGYDLGIMANGQVVATFRNGTHIDGLSSVGLVQAGVWQHIVVVQEASTCYVKIYKNGTLDTTLTNQQCFINPANTFTIGSRGGTGPFPGVLDDARVYNRALTQSEITQLYGAGGAKINASQNNIPASTLQSGLVGLWSFNGPDMSGVTAYDRSGQGNDGTLTNGPTRTIGKVGQGLNFDGVNDYVDAGSNTSLDDIPQMTISAWIKPISSGVGGIGNIFRKGSNDTMQSWTSQFSAYCTACLGFTHAFSGIDGYWSAPSNSLVLGQWQFIAITYDSTSALNAPVFYVNGVATSTAVNAAPLGNSDIDATQNLYIGGRSDTRYFNGNIDEARIYDRTLTANEIRQLYLLGR